MTRPLSIDLRERVIDAVDGGMSRRAAAERFGVSISAAIKWVQRWRETGNRQPHAQGGDYRSHRIEAHAGEIFALVNDQPDITLVEITEHLEQERNLRVAPSTVWRFFDRRDVTFKKPHTPANKVDLMSWRGGAPGSKASFIWTRTNSYSLMRPGLRPRWRGSMAVRHAVSGAGQQSPMDTGKRPLSSAP